MYYMRGMKDEKPEDILRFIIQWRSKNDIADDVNLSDSQITDFVRDLQEEISKMDFGKKGDNDYWLFR